MIRGLLFLATEANKIPAKQIHDEGAVLQVGVLRGHGEQLDVGVEELGHQLQLPGTLVENEAAGRAIVQEPGAGLTTNVVCDHGEHGVPVEPLQVVPLLLRQCRRKALLCSGPAPTS